MIKVYNWFKSPQHLIGASILRIIFGVLIVYTYIVNYPLRHYFWGNEGIIDNATYIEMNRIFFSVYGLFESPLIFELIYHLGIIIAFSFTIGFGGKTTQILNYIFTFSLINRNGLISDGGDNLMYICLLYMLFMNVTAYFSFKIKKQESKLKIKWKDQLAIIHNFGFIFVIAQLCLMYFMSGLYQVMGERWHTGTAVYYVMQVEQYSTQLLPDFLLNNPEFIVLATYASILIKLAFPFAIFNKYTKYIVIFSIVSFHIGILLQMGLVTFSLIMIAVDFLLISNSEYRWLYTKIVQLINKTRIKFKLRKNTERKSA